MILKLIDKRKELKGITTFIFKPDKKIKWIAGQYLIYSLPHENSDLRGKQRFFTISSAPHQNFPSITTRIEKGASSFKNTLDKLKIGGVIYAKGPDGDFVLEKNSEQNIFIAGGIGITPFIAILRDLSFKKNPYKIKLLYANKNSSILFKKELDQLSFQNKNFEVEYFIGRRKLKKETVRQFISKKATFFVSGPDPMVADFEYYLRKNGVVDNRLKLDYFSGYKKI
ncbi:MAG: hypothetical protein A2798_03105 [Candidatus Levybacteria bacterium RIFCSPHIGHO2_01_FULL_37_17]|nr:MAG: hypothetical protein A2798_03105 [Candidatus Levybacteria bacterium RIFCSPHIGHO2_01_FULL_37_17]OGH36843.1 MAG: hypothetical protein A2959_01095 [Candidatus Levybacteria bacterium RIFCSPLOWO2_01_FULL_38_23]